jgi:hypothetical protein
MSFHPFIHYEGRLHDFSSMTVMVVALQPLSTRRLQAVCRILLSSSIWKQLTPTYL